MNLIPFMTTVVFAGACSVVFAGDVVPSAPDSPDKAARYLIYVHGSGIDRSGVDRAKENFRGNSQAFADRGFTVVAEIRPRGTIRRVPEDLDAYAKKIADQVTKLLAAQVPAGSITVVGYSRGGAIALMVSGFVGNPDVHYAILAGCVSEGGAFKQFAPMLMSDYAPKLKGRFFSLVDESDPDFASCASYFARASEKPTYNETILRTGKGHDLFCEPLDVWVRPVAEWASAR